MSHSNRPPLKPLHSSESLSEVKLQQLSRISTNTLQLSLIPGQIGALKARPDGTMLDGHHRVHILRLRGLDVDSLPREIVNRAELSS
jgi:hypothetical protein